MVNRFVNLILLWNLLPLLFAKDGEITEKMCHKYAKEVYVLEPDLTSSSELKFNNVSECGIVSVPLIIGGVEGHDKEFPHFALIGYGADPNATLKWYCGGTLISEEFVLTAAHCNHSRDMGPAQKIKLGLTTLNEDEQDPNAIQEELISTIIIHPEYKRPHKYHDIALVKLKQQVKFTPFVRPACLNTQYAIKQSNAIAIGFGVIDQDTEETSSYLMKVTLPLIKRDICVPYYPPRHVMKFGLTDSMFCAGELEGGKDTCQGDSGGPLQVILEEPYCMYSVIGITSFGSFCGFANSPGIYTNISYYIGWIEEVVWKRQ